MPLEEVDQLQGYSSSSEPECQSDARSSSRSDQADAHGSSSDSDGDGSAMRKDVEDLYSSDGSASHTPAQKSKRRLPTPSPPKRQQYQVTQSDSEDLYLESLLESPRLGSVVRVLSGRMLQNGALSTIIKLT